MTASPAHTAAYRHGIDLFNEEKFFDAHEVLEDVWRAAPEPEKRFLQGLIQVAVALHHHSRGNVVGCLSLLTRGGRNLSLYGDLHDGVDLARLRADLQLWSAALAHDGSVSIGEGAVPPLPKLILQNNTSE